MEVLEKQYIQDRMLARRKMRSFYLGVQGVVKSFGCPAKDRGIEFSQDEQERAEICWAHLNAAFNRLQDLIEECQIKDRKKLRWGKEYGEEKEEEKEGN